MDSILHRKAIVCFRWIKQEGKSHWFYYLCKIITLGCIVWWIPTKQLPWPGVSVAILAVLAALMSVHPKIMPHHKFIYFFLIAALLFTEFRAMRKDREDAQHAQDKINQQAESRLNKLLDTEHDNTEQLLDQENANLNGFLKQDQSEFANTIRTLLAAHRQDEKEFSGVLKEQRALNESQQDFSEQFLGRLVPGNDPTPHNACLPDGQNPKEGEILSIFGDMSAIGPLPQTVLW